MYQGKRIAVIIAAAGSGTRMGGGISKQYLRIGKEMVLEKALKAFAEHPFVDDIYLVVKKGDMDFCRKEFSDKRQIPKFRAILSGGSHRQASVYNGLKLIESFTQNGGEREQSLVPPDFILVHDGARPFVSDDEISRLIDSVARFGAATLGVPVKDSIAKVENLWVKESLDRSLLYSVQTPQGFLFSKILEAHKKAAADGFVGTDDAGLVRRMEMDVALVPGEYENIKITTASDLRQAGEDAGAPVLPDGPDPVSPPVKSRETQVMRVGTGFDVHAFAPGRELILGGVHIPWGLGLQGHSDADVLTHAIMDALLGACGLGDIGAHFPDDQPRYKDISSLALLAEVRTAMAASGFETGNIDAVVIAEKPKIAPYIKTMKDILANILGIKTENINIKGTTTEGLGFCGRREGIAAMASVTVVRHL